MEAKKPIEGKMRYLKYGFVHMESKTYCCPECRKILNAGPNYQPKYCCECGQELDFTEIKWGSDKQIGYKEEEENYGKEKLPKIC